MKAIGIKSLAQKILDKSFNPKLISKMTDEEAINYLSSLRQIGRWSAEMVLIFFITDQIYGQYKILDYSGAISNNYKKKYLPPKTLSVSCRKNFPLIVLLQ